MKMIMNPVSETEPPIGEYVLAYYPECEDDGDDCAFIVLRRLAEGAAGTHGTFVSEGYAYACDEAEEAAHTYDAPSSYIPLPSVSERVEKVASW